MGPRAADTYDVVGFRAGRSTLGSPKVTELGDVQGLRLLHFQCHFRMDRLSWVRPSASAVGADLSSKAIARAPQLSAAVGIAADVVCSKPYQLPATLDDEFDIVITSCGVLCRLPERCGWVAVVAHLLVPASHVCIVEQHPAGNVLTKHDRELGAGEPYFDVGPLVKTSDGSYADRTAVLRNTTSYEGPHPHSDGVNPLIGVGLGIEFLHKFLFRRCQRRPSMVKGGGESPGARNFRVASH